MNEDAKMMDRHRKPVGVAEYAAIWWSFAINFMTEGDRSAAREEIYNIIANDLVKRPGFTRVYCFDDINGCIREKCLSFRDTKATRMQVNSDRIILYRRNGEVIITV